MPGVRGPRRPRLQDVGRDHTQPGPPPPRRRRRQDRHRGACRGNAATRAGGRKGSRHTGRPADAKPPLLPLQAARCRGQQSQRAPALLLLMLPAPSPLARVVTRAAAALLLRCHQGHEPAVLAELRHDVALPRQVRRPPPAAPCTGSAHAALHAWPACTAASHSRAHSRMHPPPSPPLLPNQCSATHNAACLHQIVIEIHLRPAQGTALAAPAPRTPAQVRPPASALLPAAAAAACSHCSCLLPQRRLLLTPLLCRLLPPPPPPPPRCC